MTLASAQEDLHGEPFIVPLAIPYVAGPSVLAVELLLISDEPSKWPVWLAAITIAWAATKWLSALDLEAWSRLND